ncbi:hypothetical protein SODALDRAFT_333603 [Sodiomyces alkalinus F11]|uniref:Uncharacterized protein n=1 Tax=Sodiomyces alkalinus (strain CBS 110278 / VKM F-3762 / F11) TaxID=1314773 RepID=A0A3N2PTM6_SODAK|nr:hypothetical protein SODALDRAFT_333603 [Sodiomyces alkalinus F11]ROT37853.1 hypothetical protein SODALDRAFT_333603 [Sodiomyces alkalinus F11]
MLLLSQALRRRDRQGLSERFLEAAVRILRDTIDFCGGAADGGDAPLLTEDMLPGRTFDGILKNGTANRTIMSTRGGDCMNHGLIYGDCYFVECGSRLMQMGLV